MLDSDPNLLLGLAVAGAGLVGTAIGFGVQWGSQRAQTRQQQAMLDAMRTELKEARESMQVARESQRQSAAEMQGLTYKLSHVLEDMRELAKNSREEHLDTRRKFHRVNNILQEHEARLSHVEGHMGIPQHQSTRATTNPIALRHDQEDE